MTKQSETIIGRLPGFIRGMMEGIRQEVGDEMVFDDPVAIFGIQFSTRAVLLKRMNMETAAGTVIFNTSGYGSDVSNEGILSFVGDSLRDPTLDDEQRREIMEIVRKISDHCRGTIPSFEDFISFLDLPDRDQ